MIDMTQIALLVIAVVFTFCTVLIQKYLIPLLNEKLTTSQRDTLLQFVKIGVAAADQLCKSGVIKKDDRLNYVKRFLGNNNMTFDDKLVENMIESEVLKLKKTFEEVIKIEATEIKK